MRHEKKLEEFCFTFDNYLELDECDLSVEMECLQGYADDYSEEFTPYEFSLYEKAEGLHGEAKVYFDTIAREEEAEEVRDQMSYLSSECNH